MNGNKVKRYWSVGQNLLVADVQKCVNNDYRLRTSTDRINLLEAQDQWVSLGPVAFCHPFYRRACLYFIKQTHLLREPGLNDHIIFKFGPKEFVTKKKKKRFDTFTMSRVEKDLWMTNEEKRDSDGDTQLKIVQHKPLKQNLCTKKKKKNGISKKRRKEQH